METQQLVTLLRRRWLNILVVTLVVLATGVVLTLLATPRYTASTKMFFGVSGGESVSDLAQGSTFTEKQMTSYAQVATSPLVLDAVVKQLSLGTNSAILQKSVRATPTTDTVILEISVTDTDATQCARMANSVAEQLAEVAASLSPERPNGTEAVRATILASAQTPETPSSPLLLRNITLSLVFGLLMGTGLVFLRQALDTKIRNQRDLESMTDSAILGVIPFDESAAARPVVMHDEIQGARSEAVRRLRTNLQFVDVGGDAKSIVISSSVAGEGKTTTAINLAVSMADTGTRVVLVDADLRRPSVAKYLGMEQSVGLTTVLIGLAKASEIVQQWQGTTLDILPAGQIPPNPSELVGSQAMAELLTELLLHYDIVLLDSPPLLPVTDAIVLSKLTAGSLIVVGADHIHQAQVRQALDSLATVGANILGLVLNKIAKKDSSAYSNNYSYYSTQSDLEITRLHDPLSTSVPHSR